MPVGRGLRAARGGLGTRFPGIPLAFEGTQGRRSWRTCHLWCYSRCAAVVLRPWVPRGTPGESRETSFSLCILSPILPIFSPGSHSGYGSPSPFLFRVRQLQGVLQCRHCTWDQTLLVLELKPELSPKPLCRLCVKGCRPAEVCPRWPGTGLMPTLSSRSRGHRSVEDCHLSQNEWVPLAQGVGGRPGAVRLLREVGSVCPFSGNVPQAE